MKREVKFALNWRAVEHSGKLYYSIGDVAEILGENVSLVRFWSDKFSAFIKPVRNKKGNRLFTEKDIDTFKLIHHFVKDLGLTLEGAQKRLKENATGEDMRLAVIEKLRAIKKKLLSITADSEDIEEDEDDDDVDDFSIDS